MKKKTKKSKKKPKLVNGLVSETVVWKDAYPFIEESYRVDEEIVVVSRYPSEDSSDYEEFLYKVIRSDNLPPFMKNNLKRIKKLLEKEIQHREKLYEKLSKEQVKSFESFFKDKDFFDRSEEDEYFEHEVEKVFMIYVREYLNTGLYESKARLTNRRRKKTLQSHGLKPNG